MEDNMNEESNDFLVNYFFLQEFVKYFGYLQEFVKYYLVVVVTCIR